MITHSNKQKEYAAKYRKSHRKECLEQSQRWRDENREKYREYFRNRRKTVEGKYSKYKYRAKKGGRIFSLTLTQFRSLTSQSCHYCGEKLSTTVGIDRKDNTIGYTLKNSVPCCWPCNKLKGSRAYDDFVLRCKKIAKHL